MFHSICSAHPVWGTTLGIGQTEKWKGLHFVSRTLELTGPISMVVGRESKELDGWHEGEHVKSRVVLWPKEV